MSTPRATELVNEGIAAARAGDSERARTALRQAIGLDANNSSAWLWLAGVAETPTAAIPALERALQLDPGSHAARAAINVARFEAGVAAAQDNRRDDAHRLLHQTCADDPKNESAWLWLAAVTDDPATGIRHLEQALHLNPNNTRAKAGIDRLRAQFRDSALWCCPICLARAESRFTTCVECGAVLDLAYGDAAIANPSPNIAKIRDGIARLTQSVQTNPDFVNQYYLGMALLNLGKPDQAVRHLQAARALRPDDRGLSAQIDVLERALEETAQPTRRMTVPAWHPAQKKSILVVDDSATMRKLVGMTMEKNGFRVVEAQDGLDALATIESGGTPDLVVLDVTMPRMDGYSFCRALRQNRSTAQIPVIMLSARDGFLDRMRGRMAGTDAYLTKPFVPAVLVRVVREFCPIDDAVDSEGAR